MLLKAFAKINWSLDITGVRPDGYHLLDMVMQPVSLSDEIRLSPASGLSLATGGTPPSRADSTNLAWKAADLLRREYNVSKGVHIDLQKSIPMGAGLGGGSADAAAVLFGLSRFWNLNIPSRDLETLGLRLGADVPFCLRGGLVRTRGIGEQMEDHPCALHYWMILIQPCRGLSTGTVFSAWHDAASPRRPDTEQILLALRSGDPALLSASLFNVLEPVSSSLCPEIPEAVSALLAAGAFAARMTGSGSAVFGAFRSRVLAEKAFRVLSPRYRTIHLCHSQTDSIRMMEE